MSLKSRFSIISFLPLVSTHSFTGKFFDLAISRFGTIFFKVVSEKEEVLKIFEENKVFFATLGLASDVTLQSTKENIGEDAVSVVIADGTIYIPFAELVDIDKEIERLKKEEKKLTGEIKRCEGMLGNPNFVNKAPEKKIAEEREKLEKYKGMMEQVKERLAHFTKP